MFWIYGGNLQFGTGRLPDYDGSSFAANQDVIVVTFNYRTNVFGFATSPEIPLNKRNVGLYDQRKALAWVNANIHAFGGDPTRVTIFGESAGAWSVKQLFALPPHPPQFRAAIMQSQGATISGTGSAEWTALATALNCTTATSPLTCVRAAPAAAIRTAIESAALSFPPSFDNATATQHVEARLGAGAGAAPVPLLLGNNAAEGSIFANNLPSAPALLASIFGAANTSLALAARAAYPATLSDELLRVRIIGDALFTCLSRDFADAAAGSGYQRGGGGVWDVSG
ncbi:putative para-nitrobenzyl esterase protein [Neofusicoccum parvum UCRNP2]|uniref:Carboxylic ester hydrolase n=1 Tax=Botryosphaeria parva (strain UCR-NP2) TaxID=1287680 RepID=R1EK21_BOTPV|nr:putative para-nitrobenzyl esterase protein [Neofusicoccum parvum UCRNP2]